MHSASRHDGIRAVTDTGDTARLPSALRALDALSTLMSLNASIENARAGMSELFTVSANQVTEIAHESGHGNNGPGTTRGLDSELTSSAARDLKDSITALTAQHSGR